MKSMVDSVSSLESVNDHRKDNEARTKTSRRRKIRRLVVEENKDEIAPNPDNDKKMPPKALISNHFKSIFLVMTLLLTGITIYSRLPSQHPKTVFKNFLNSYRKQYYQILYGKMDYCSKELYTETLMERIRPIVLNQDEVLKQLANELYKNKRITSIALVGSSGVGKTLTGRALQQSFPWPDNVHVYAWNTYVSDYTERYNVINLYINGLSDCGRNLMIMDNLTPCDAKLVSLVEEQLSETVAKSQQVIVLFIFNLNTLESDDVYDRHLELVNNLTKTTKTKTIFFRPFDVSDLYDCIEHEAKLENVTLKSQDIDEILRMIDVRHSGCKNVRAKVLLYGKRY